MLYKMEVPEHEKLTNLVFEKIGISAASVVTGDTLAHAKLDVRFRHLVADHVTDDLVFKLQLPIWSRLMSEETRVIPMPTNWWQHLKEWAYSRTVFSHRFFAWIPKHYPVKTYKVTYKSSKVFHSCPHLDIDGKTNHRHMKFMACKTPHKAEVTLGIWRDFYDTVVRLRNDVFSSPHLSMSGQSDGAIVAYSHLEHELSKRISRIEGIITQDGGKP